MDQAVAEDRRSMLRSATTARRFSLSARRRSFVYAARGIRAMIASQHNARIHVAATFIVVGLGFFLGITRLEWTMLVMAIVSVWAAEAVNTAVESLCDVTSPDFHPLVEAAKDVAAGAVLICAIGAALTGALVLGPPLWAALR